MFLQVLHSQFYTLCHCRLQSVGGKCHFFEKHVSASRHGGRRVVEDPAVSIFPNTPWHEYYDFHIWGNLFVDGIHQDPVVSPAAYLRYSGLQFQSAANIFEQSYTWRKDGGSSFPLQYAIFICVWIPMHVSFPEWYSIYLLKVAKRTPYAWVGILISIPIWTSGGQCLHQLYACTLSVMNIVELPRYMFICQVSTVLLFMKRC